MWIYQGQYLGVGGRRSQSLYHGDELRTTDGARVVKVKVLRESTPELPLYNLPSLVLHGDVELTSPSWCFLFLFRFVRGMFISPRDDLMGDESLC